MSPEPLDDPDRGATPAPGPGRPARRRPLRVLMSAYACGPREVSEPGAGWAMLRAAAARHRVTLLTVPRYADQVREVFAAEGDTSVRVIAVTTPAWMSRFRGKVGMGHVDYAYWQFRAWKVARGLAPEVDVAHHATYSSDWTPVAVHFLGDLPTVWGPVGGTAPFAWRLLPHMSVRGFLFEVIRTSLTNLARGVTAAAVRRSGCVVVGASREAAVRFAGPANRTFVEPACALPPAPTAREGAPGPDPDRVHRAVFVGRLRSWKGPYLAVQAMAHLPGNWHLDVFGDGPETDGLRARAERLGIGDRVHLHGQRPREDVFAALLGADVFLFPTLHDTAAYSVAEAVRVGCPVVCLDVPGPPGLIEGTTGIAVPVSADVPRRLARAMQQVSPHPPSDRWNGDRFVELVDDWYRAAVGDRPAGHGVELTAALGRNGSGDGGELHPAVLRRSSR